MSSRVAENVVNRVGQAAPASVVSALTDEGAVENPTAAVSSVRLIFGPFCLIPAERLLTRDGMPIEIGGRSLDLLIALAEQPGQVIAKRELIKRVWPDVVVEDGSLRFHMAGLRTILRDGEDGARYISTQVGVGYAFVAPVHRLDDADRSRGAGTAGEPVSLHDNTAQAPAGSMPRRSVRMIGRDQDLHLLCDRIRGASIFSIVGPAGVGKTTLAVEIGHALQTEFAGKVSFVDLGALQDPTLVPSALASALGILVQGEDPTKVILGHIRVQRRLIILDTCEHLIDAVCNLAERIEDAAPHVTILATSREALRIHGEHVHRLGPLGYPEDASSLSLPEVLAFPAVELFVERASASDSGLQVDAPSARLIADMCRRLDGMALPIELTAVRVASHGLDATAKLLGESFSLGWAGRRTALPRQQTVQATLDWSYELLTEAEQHVLERLSVFLGPFSIEAALAVVSDDLVTLNAAAGALDALTAKSLVAPDRSAEVMSYRLLDMTRTYAHERLAARGRDAVNSAARRHALFFRAELQAVDPVQMDAARVACFSRSLANVRRALEWSFGSEGDLAIGCALASASAPVFINLSLLVECRTWCSRAAASIHDFYRGTAVELELQAALGLCLMFTRGNSDAAEVALRRALDLAVDLEDSWNQLRLLGRLHIFHERIGDFRTARAWAEMALAVAAQIGEPEAVAVASSLAGISYHLAGDQAAAHRELEQSLRNALPSERSRTTYYGFDHRNRSGIALARTLWLQGHPDRARDVAERTVSEAERLDHPVTYCIALVWTLSVYLWTGDHEKARACLEVFSRMADVNAFAPYIAASGGFRGTLAVQNGAAPQALGPIEESLARLHAARYELLTTSFEIALIEGLLQTQRAGEAQVLIKASIERCNGNGDQFSMPELLRIKAAIDRLNGGSPDDVAAVLMEAIACSRAQGALAWELRATIDLATHLAESGSTSEALAALEMVRAQISEGQDTADVAAADALLSDLRAAA